MPTVAQEAVRVHATPRALVCLGVEFVCVTTWPQGLTVQGEGSQVGSVTNDCDRKVGRWQVQPVCPQLWGQLEPLPSTLVLPVHILLSSWSPPDSEDRVAEAATPDALDLSWLVCLFLKIYLPPPPSPAGPCLLSPLEAGAELEHVKSRFRHEKTVPISLFLI